MPKTKEKGKGRKGEWVEAAAGWGGQKMSQPFGMRIRPLRQCDWKRGYVRGRWRLSCLPRVTGPKV